MKYKLSMAMAVILSLTAVLALSCKKQEEPAEQPGKIRISPTVTKVTETQFEEGDAIGVIITRNSGEVYADNVKMTYKNGVFESDLDWYFGDETCIIRAYYPYSSTLPETFTVPADQSEGYSSADYLFGNRWNVTPTNKTVGLSFYHEMVRLEIKVSNQSGKTLENLRVGDVAVSALIDSFYPYAPNDAERTEVVPCLQNGSYYALIPPQAASSLNVRFSVDGSARECSVLVEDEYLYGETQYSISVFINPSLEVSAIAGEVKDWIDYPTIFPKTADIYDLLKEYSEVNFWTATYFSRYFVFMSELRADNICASGNSEDAIWYFLRYLSSSGISRGEDVLWNCLTPVIAEANRYIKVGAFWSAQSEHFLGECYFFRAFAHFVLVNLYARPYTVGKDDSGFVLMRETGSSTATVAEVYALILSDLEKAIEHMSGNDDSSRDKGYVTTTAAKALLSRVYLYMEDNEKCAALCDELLGSDPSSLLATDLDNYFKLARTQNETIWCVAYDPEENPGEGGIGSMFYGTPYDIGGSSWVEFFWSDPLIELFGRYPADKRFQAYFHQYDKTGDGTKLVHWPVEKDGYNYRTNAIVQNLQPDADGNVTFTYNDQTDTTEKKSKAGVNNGYPQYFINYGGEETQVYVRDNVNAVTGVRNSFPRYMMSKFSGQDGIDNLCSPVMFRWAEIILNRAEARAKLGDAAGALADVNVLRRRAGLSDDAMMSVSNYAERGYSNVLDVVLDERRMELCFEGHRFFDVYRNKKQMDRRYAGYHPWEVIDYTDSRILYNIPNNQ